MKSKLMFIVISLMAASVLAARASSPKGSVGGRILDEMTGKPVGFANVMIYSGADSTMADGGISDEDGYFYITSLKGGRYYASVKFIGYHIYQSDLFTIGKETSEIKLPDIFLKRASLEMSQVQVLAERPQIEFKADKKIIYADQYAAALSGTAVEILENVPSVNVDVEGNVTLRGSSSFLVLVDGHPSVFKGGDALEQVPAPIIESIEIITNPSAKYDPDGTTGIINIITKKQKISGTSGLMTVKYGTYGSYGGSVNLSHRTPKLTYSALFSYDKFKMGGHRYTEKDVTVDDTTFSTLGSGRGRMGRDSYSGKGGVDWQVNNMTSANFQYSSGYRERPRLGLQTYTQTVVPGSSEPTIYTTENTNDRATHYQSALLGFNHKFNKDGHEVTGSAEMNTNNGSEDNDTRLYNKDGLWVKGTQNTEETDETEYRFKLDYVLPFSDTRRFEAGLQSRISSENSVTSTAYLDTNKIYIQMPQYRNDNDYRHTIHSLYAIFKDRLGLIDYQLGIRPEYTYRDMSLVAQDTTYRFDRWDIFPTVHLSMPFSDHQQFMTSYSRRIERPRNYYLEPYQTQRDAYSAWRGNPDLLPEYINAAEFSWQYSHMKNFISLDFYHRTTENKIEKVQSILSENVILYTVANVGQEYSTGAELAVNYNPAKFWTIMVSGNVYKYQVKGSFDGIVFDNTSNNWSMKMNNTLFLSTETRIQIDGNYQGPSLTSQGETKANWVANAAVKQDFPQWNLTASLQVRDLFNTAQMESVTYGNGFINKTVFDRDAPAIVFSLNWKINNYKEKRNPQERTNGSSDGGDDVFL